VDSLWTLTDSLHLLTCSSQLALLHLQHSLINFNSSITSEQSPGCVAVQKLAQGLKRADPHANLLCYACKSSFSAGQAGMESCALRSSQQQCQARITKHAAASPRWTVGWDSVGLSSWKTGIMIYIFILKANTELFVRPNHPFSLPYLKWKKWTELSELLNIWIYAVFLFSACLLCFLYRAPIFQSKLIMK